MTPERSILSRISGAMSKVEAVLAALSGAACAAIMFIVVVDVVMRYVFARPLFWSYEVISLYLVVAVFFLALSDTLHHHGHIAIDFFRPMVPRRIAHVAEAIGYLLATGVMSLISWQAWDRLVVAWLGDDRIAATIPWPTWIAYLIVTVGSAVLTLRCAYRAVGHAASAATGRELVETPAPFSASPAEVGR